MRILPTLITLLFSLSVLANHVPSPVDTLTFSVKANYHQRLPEAVELLSEYIKNPSVTGNEADAGRFLKDFCEQQGLFVQVFSAEKNSYNFSASLLPLSLKKPNIILMHHIDVVDEGDRDFWVQDPYSGLIQNEEIWGRGAIDAKGLGVMQLMALLDIKSRTDLKDLPYNITLLCVSNEESGGMLGAQWVVNNYLDLLNPSVVLGEGGSGFSGMLSSKPDVAAFGVSIAEKSNLWLELSLRYENSGHGATPAINYANKELIRALSNLNNRKTKLHFNKANRTMMRELGKAEGGIKGFFIRRSNWSIFIPFVKNYIKDDPLYRSFFINTITVTNLYNPHGPPNSVPNIASATLDCRLLPDIKKEAFLRQIKRQMNSPKMEIRVINESPFAESTKPDKYFEALKASIQANYQGSYVVPVLFPATTDNSYFREKGIPTYGLIPSILNQEYIETVHGVNERISFEALNSGIRVYSGFLEKFTHGKERRFKLQLLEKKGFKL